MDPDGRSTWVINREDGTYEVIGGDVNDGDKNIYLYTKDNDGNYTVRGNSLGESMTEYSFFGESGEAIKGAIINPNDNSGTDFLNNEIIADDPHVLYYMPNATGGKKYDFKRRDIENRPEGMETGQYHYRGMPLKDADGNTVYGSARDVGNYGAGYVAGKTGLAWKTARMGFDLLESYQNRELSTEGRPTQRAERLGYNAGKKQYLLHTANTLLNRLFNRSTK